MSVISRPDWVSDLARGSLGDIEVTAEIDADLSLRALAARTDPAQRDQLFVLLSMKVNRFASRFRRWTLNPWEFDDVLQEAYLAFDDLLRTWQPLEGNGGPAGFGFYFLRVFPLRLHDRVLAMTRTRSDQPLVLPWQEAIDLRPDPVDRQSDAETALILAEICGHLNAVDEAILRCRVADTSDVSTIAMRVGVSRRTLYRRWGRIIAIARNEWGNREAG